MTRSRATILQRCFPKNVYLIIPIILFRFSRLSISVFSKNYIKKNKINCLKTEIDTGVNNLGRRAHNPKIRIRVNNLEIRLKTNNSRTKIDAKIYNSKSKIKVNNLKKK